MIIKHKYSKALTKAGFSGVANLLMGDQQGKLFYLLGSPSSVLKDGNNAFDTILNEFPDHELAVYVQFVKGVDAGRKFKIIEKDEVKVLREREPDKSIDLLDQVAVKSKQGEGLDNISTNYAMRQISRQYLIKENAKKAKETMDDMVKFFSGMDLNTNVISTIKKQAKETLQSKKVSPKEKN
ncbi:MAG TPA: hypothetical protein VJ767_05820 [Nitrososphaeraceae archaeon]|nr:hypothetical protein [Nitrososphaeraceae archaeon]